MRLALALLLAACSSGARAPTAPTPPAPTTRWTGSLSPPPATGAEVVADVNGDRIFLADVETQMRAAGQTPDQALAELVAATLFAQEAYRRGLADDPEVREARDRESVRLFLRRVFEPSFDGPEDIPEDEVEAVFDLPSVHNYYEHEEAHTVAYCRAEVPPKSTDEVVEAARRNAETMRGYLAAARPRTAEELGAVIQAHPELDIRFTGKPFTTALAGPAQPTFARAAMALKTIGELSPVVRTPWGWDILLLQGIIPARHTPLDVVYAEIRKNRFEPSRKLAFERWVNGFLAGHKVTQNDAALEAVHVESLVGMP